MRLEKLAQDYIRYKQALGARFKTDAMHLSAFFELLNGRQSDISLSFVNEDLWRGSKTVAYLVSKIRCPEWLQSVSLQPRVFPIDTVA
jgi:hypothetical protein